MLDWLAEDACSGLVCGVDEAGRGPWAGPVVAGAVVFYQRDINPYLLTNLNDSKKLSRKKREELFTLIEQEKQKGSLSLGIGLATAQEIDNLNILRATFVAMTRAVAQLPKHPDYALIDGNQKPAEFPCRVKTIVHGDAKSMSIAAASIIAKVHRDRLMMLLAEKYPGYGFEKNAGYGTEAHVQALKLLGITPEHRKSFRPIAEIINQHKQSL